MIILSHLFICVYIWYFIYVSNYLSVYVLKHLIWWDEVIHSFVKWCGNNWWCTKEYEGRTDSNSSTRLNEAVCVATLLLQYLLDRDKMIAI